MIKEFKINTYKDLILEKSECSKIPKYIFRTSHYHVNELPAEVLKLYQNEYLSNPEYKLFYFDDRDCESLINDTHDNDLISAYDSLNAGAYKADIIRYLLMYIYGGVYMDFTMKSLVPLDDIIKNNELILVKDLESSLSGIYNAFICSKKENKLFKNLINEIVVNIKKRVYFDNVWELTGPIALKKEFYNTYDCNNLDEYKLDESIILYKLNDTGLINNQHNISDIDGNIIIETRLPNHYDILYKKDKSSYPELFKSKKIYKNKFKSYNDFKKTSIEVSNDVVSSLIFRTGSFNINELHIDIANLYDDTLSKNEGYTMVYFDDNDRYNFIKENYPERYINAYNKLIPKAYQADFFRYLVVFKYGGIYMDFSMSPLIPLKDIIKSYKSVYVRDRLDMPIMYNAFIATIKGCPILKLAIEKCITNIENNDYGYDTLCVTSPIILGEAICESGIDGVFVNGKIQLGEINKDLYIYSFENGDGEFFKNPETNNFVVKNKIDNHYNILYKDSFDTLRYHSLWENKIVFKDDLFFKIEEEYKKLNKRPIDLLLAVYIYKKCMDGYDIHEYISRAKDIIELYLCYLKRDSDSSGLMHYMDSKMNMNEIKESIINSEEYRKKLHL